MSNYSVVYREPRTVLKYDSTHIIGYLNEKVLSNYQPEANTQDNQPDPYTGYQYTGVEKDGGTIMPCQDITSYHDVVNALIRSKYSESEEMAVNRHKIGGDDAYAEEWKTYNDWCEQAKSISKSWLGITD
ncbi:MAG TPA: hypothetical protein DCS83_06840 [Prevotella sp.]|nr:hypothetical protein [Prevotella sp.]